MSAQEADVVVVLAQPVGQALEGQEHLGDADWTLSPGTSKTLVGHGSGPARKPLTLSLSHPSGRPSSMATVAASW